MCVEPVGGAYRGVLSPLALCFAMGSIFVQVHVQGKSIPLLGKTHAPEIASVAEWIYFGNVEAAPSFVVAALCFLRYCFFFFFVLMVN